MLAYADVCCVQDDREKRIAKELQDMREGTYVRWIHSKRRKLTNGAFLVRVDLRDDGIHMLLRNGYNQMFSLWADECMLFQKITAEERVMLMAKARL